MTCPYCGHDDSDASFRTPEVREHIQRHTDRAIASFTDEILTDLLKPLERTLEDISRQSRRGAIGIQMSLHRTRAPLPPLPDTEAPADLLRNVACDVCGRAYGVFGTALFCPDCGAANLTVHADAEIGLVKQDLLEANELTARGDMERAQRRLNNSLEDIASALEFHLKAVFFVVTRARLDRAEAEDITNRVANDFQNSGRGRRHFARFAFDPYGVLTSHDVTKLDAAMSKRHVIAHNLGLVDRTFVAKGGAGRPGESLAVTSDAVLEFADSYRLIVDHCQAVLPELSCNTLPSTRTPHDS